MALHFIGFKDDRVWNARRVFGAPDFWHRHWDVRASQEVVTGDIAIFANGDCREPIKEFSWNDSEQDIIAYATKEQRE